MLNTMNCDDAKKLIEKYNLKSHPEGGFYTQTYKSIDQVKSTCGKYDNETRSAGSSIYYLLNQNDFSAWHRLKSDEIWHYYKGSALIIYMIDTNGVLTKNILGDTMELDEANFQIFVRADNYFAAEIIDKSSYAFVGCTVNPGFEFQDFELISKNKLIKLFPQHVSYIEKLTRD